MLENRLMEPSIDDEALRRVAEAFPSVTQEQIREVLRLKTTTRLGYRRIGQKIDPPLGKDMVMRMWKMYEVTAKPPQPPEPSAEEAEFEKLRARVAEKRCQKRILEEKERLLREDVRLSLELEGDNLVLRMIEDEIAKRNPRLYEKFKRYCEQIHLGPHYALEKLGITAYELLEDFDSWYEEYQEIFYPEVMSGMDCLYWKIRDSIIEGIRNEEEREQPAPNDEVNAGLPRLNRRKTHASQ